MRHLLLIRFSDRRYKVGIPTLEILTSCRWVRESTKGSTILWIIGHWIPNETVKEIYYGYPCFWQNLHFYLRWRWYKGF